MYQNGLQNKVPGLKLIENPSEIRSIEPLCDGGLQAIWCGTTGIVDFTQIAAKFADEFKSNGGTIYTDCEVTNFTGIDRVYSKDFANGITVHTMNGDKSLESAQSFQCRHVITCCGVYSDRVSEWSGSSKYPLMVPFRGDYLKIKNRALNQKFSGANIYPVPNPKFPALGVHFTPMLFDGEMEYILGPSAVFAFGKENYWFTRNINIRDTVDVLKNGAFWKMAAKHWKHGVSELVKDVLIKKQIDELRRYVSELQYEDVDRSFSGIRAQSMDEHGNLSDDFVIETECPESRNSAGRFVNVRNAPSPACTSSIAIGEMIVDKAVESFQLDRTFQLPV